MKTSVLQKKVTSNELKTPSNIYTVKNKIYKNSFMFFYNMLLIYQKALLFIL